MSPQQWTGEPPAVADDIYSLGVTIYELLTGKPPFYDGDVFTQLHEVIPPSMTERLFEFGVEDAAIPLLWEETIAACLAKDAARRPGQRPRGRRAAGVARSDLKLGCSDSRMDLVRRANYFSNVQQTISQLGSPGGKVSEARSRATRRAGAARRAIIAGKRVLLIVPDHTRTAPVGLLFKTIFATDRRRDESTRRADRPRHASADERSRDLRAAGNLRSPNAARSYGRSPLLQPRVGQSRRAQGNRHAHRRRGQRAHRRPVRDGRAGGDQPARVRLRPGHHRRPGVSARSRRLFRRQQVSLPRRGRPANSEFLPLARRGRHQPDDHRQQVDARAQGGGPRGRVGRACPSSASAWWSHRTNRSPGFSSARRKRRGTPPANFRSKSTSSTRTSRFRPSSPRCRRCTTTSGSPASACTSSNPWWPTAANSSSTRRTSTRFPSRTAKSSSESATTAATTSSSNGTQFKHYPWGVLAHSTHVRGIGTLRERRREMPRPGHARDGHPGACLPENQPGLPRPENHPRGRFCQS